MADGGDNTCCPVCLENYTEEGDTVPRILPCSHTLCSGCLTQLKHSSPGSSFTCPIDRKPFPKTEHFPENRYIIGSLTTRHVELKETSDFLKCQEHKSRDLSLHCKECKADICELCMNKDHLGHNVTDIQDHLEETKDEFIAAVASLRGEVEKRKLKTVELKKQVQVINSACLDNLKSTRAAIMRHFDELEAQVMCEIDGTQTEFLTQEKQLQEMAEKSSNLQQKIKEASPAEMMKRKKSLQEMKKNLKELPTRDSFKTFRFSKQPLTDQCLKLITESFKVGQLVTKRHDSSENVRLEGLCWTRFVFGVLFNSSPSSPFSTCWYSLPQAWYWDKTTKFLPLEKQRRMGSSCWAALIWRPMSRLVMLLWTPNLLGWQWYR